MSDLTGTTDEPPAGALEAAAPVDGATPEVEVIPVPTDMAGLLSLLEPVLADVVKLAVEQAVASTPVPRKVPGKVTAVSVATRIATVIVDGDTAAISAQILGDFPIVGGRVMVEFMPPNAVFCTSVVGGLGIPGGAVIGYFGTVNYDPITTTSSPAGASPPPPGFLRPYGQVVTINAYPVGYAAMGDTYNTGGETAGTNYRLPDLRGRMVVGLDNMGGTDAGRLSTANTLGTTGGAETVTLSSANLPTHTHDMGNHTHSFTPSGSISGSVGSHTHDLGNHTHSGSGLSVSSHTHNLGSHTHTVNSHTHDLSNHTHSHTGWANGATGFAAGANWFGDSQTVTSGGPSNNNSGSASPGTGGPSTNTSGSASPGVSGNTGTPSSNTSGGATPSFSGSFSGTPGTTGTPSTNTTGNGGFANTAVNKMPPFTTANWLIRV